MLEVPVEIRELRKSADGDTIKELADYLKERLSDIEIEMTGSQLLLGHEDDQPFSRSYLRVLLRKFLHKSELADFRVIAGKEGAFIIKKRRSARE
jgi:hypothetical protein